MKAIRYISILYLLLLAGGCSYETQQEQDIDQGPSISFTLSSSTDSHTYNRATRSVDVLENEKTVNRIDLFFYDEQGTVCQFYPNTSQLTRDGNKVTVRVPSEIAETLFGQTSKVYLLVNCHLDRSSMTGKSLADLQQLTETTSVDFNGIQPQTDFLMDGMVTATLSQTQNNLGKITLKRAAAKIIVDISKAEIAGYTPGKVEVRFTNYLNKTAIGSSAQYVAQADEYKECTKELVKNGDYSYTMDGQIYSYSNEWEFDATRESYITIAMDWIDNSTQATKTYYYRIPFNYIKAEGDTDAHRFRLRRNYIYQFMVDVSVLGGLDPKEAIDLYANFEVIDWTEQFIDVTILEYHYLIVYERIIEMHNVASRKMEYKSSAPIEFLEIAAECLEYTPAGETIIKTYNEGDPEFPKITDFGVDTDGKSYFTVAASIPENYVPKNMKFKVKNRALLFAYIEVNQYPKKYVTAEFSENTPYIAGASLGNTANYPNGDGDQTNFNFYTITTVSLDELDDYTIGDPTYIGEDGNRRTGTTADYNSIVSPQFIVASQRGITLADNYADNELRCFSYQESQYPRTSWRMPTRAELQLISTLQRDPKSAIKNLFTSSSSNSAWWSAQQYVTVNLANGALPAADINTTAPVRCVHDTWRD